MVQVYTVHFLTKLGQVLPCSFRAQAIYMYLLKDFTTMEKIIQQSLACVTFKLSRN